MVEGVLGGPVIGHAWVSQGCVWVAEMQVYPTLRPSGPEGELSRL